MLTPEKGERNLWFLSVGVYHSIPASLSRTFQAFQQPISPSAPLSVFVRAPLSFAPHRWSQHRIKWKHGSSYGSKKTIEWKKNERVMNEWKNETILWFLFIYFSKHLWLSMIIVPFISFYDGPNSVGQLNHTEFAIPWGSQHGACAQLLTSRDARASSCEASKRGGIFSIFTLSQLFRLRGFSKLVW